MTVEIVLLEFQVGYVVNVKEKPVEMMILDCDRHEQILYIGYDGS